MTGIPERLQHLERDKRGYPIPWNVLRGVDGSPIFTVNDDRKNYRSLLHGLCPICGGRMGAWKWFVGGPRSAFDENGWYNDQAMHLECATFALENCPYLAAPKYLKRVDVADPSNLPPEARFLIDHTMIPERPLLFVAVATSRVEINNSPSHVPLPYTRPWRPARAYQFWRHGQQLTPEAALPALRMSLGEAFTIPEVIR